MIVTTTHEWQVVQESGITSQVAPVYHNDSPVIEIDQEKIAKKLRYDMVMLNCYPKSA